MAMDESVIREVLDEIADECGGVLTPRAVVEAARDPDHPLHGHFEWNDAQAAEQFRWTQARRLIASVRVEVRTEERVLVTYGYVRDVAQENDEQGYVAVPSMMDDRLRQRRTLLAELRRADAYLARCESMADAFGMRGPVQEVRARWATLMDECAA